MTLWTWVRSVRSILIACYTVQLVFPRERGFLDWKAQAERRKAEGLRFCRQMHEACIRKRVPNAPSSTQQTAQLHVVLQLCVQDAKQASGKNSNFFMSNPDSSDSLDMLFTAR